MRKLFGKLVKYIFIFAIVVIAVGGLFFVSVYNGVFGPFPSTEELSDIQNEEASLVLANDGSIIGKYFAENRTNIGWNDIPNHLVNALVATEDKRFYLHEGYDSRSYLRVFFKSIILGDKSSGGGSTLTQQLVKNLYGRNDHSFMSLPVNKLKEAIIAVRMEKVLTKQQILLLYLNSVPFGEDVYGVEAATLRFFGKHCNELTMEESAVLVGLLKANTYYNPRINPENAIQRRNQVLTLMEKEGYISKEVLENLKSKKLKLSYSNYQREAPAGYFVHRVKRQVMEILEDLNMAGLGSYYLEQDGLEIYTTLDLSLQKLAQRSVKKQLSYMQKLLDKQLKNSSLKKHWLKELKETYGSEKTDAIKKRELFNWENNESAEISFADSLWHYYSMLNSAVLITDPQTGKILTWIGGNDYRYLPYDMVLSQRQIASAIKPLVYAAGLNKGLVPCDYLNNEVVEYKEYNGWTPQNYDNSSTKDTLIALWFALSNSMNLPTMDLYFQTGHSAVVEMLSKFGLNPPITETPSIAIGALDVSLYDIVKAYGAFASDGYIVDDLIMIDKIKDAEGNIIYENPKSMPTQILNPRIVDQITIILEKAVNEGTGKQLRSRYGLSAELAGKTGTASNYSDAWFMSYTPNLVIGTWVGARSPDVHFRGGLGSGSSLALPIAGNILTDIEKTPSLRIKYLTSFGHQYQADQIIHCDPYFEKGISGFFHRLTRNDQYDSVNDGKSESKKEKEKPEKEKSGIRKFFDKIFKGKKK